MDLTLDTRFDAAPGEAVRLAPDVRRITAPNPGPFTFRGTNTYVVGTDRLVIVDPGPNDPRHLDAILAHLGGRPVESILVTHSHLDHTGLAAALRAATDAPLIAEGPHRPARPPREDERQRLDASGDMTFRPDRTLLDGEAARFEAGTFTAIATPGHTANHLAFSLEGTGLLFCGDHVMGWSTTIVAPPDGSMRDYMASLDKLLARDDRRLLPGHGNPIDNPQAHMRALRAHRRMREAAILDRLRSGDETIAAVVSSVYRTTDAKLHGAAALSVLAHMEALVENGLVASDGPPALGSRYRAC